MLSACMIIHHSIDIHDTYVIKNEKKTIMQSIYA